MKKTILAVVTSSLFAASANAAVVYDKDGQQVDIYGRMEYDAGQMSFKTSNAQDVKNFGGDGSARLGVNGKWATGSDVSLIGKLEYQLAGEGNDSFSSSDTTTTTFTDRYAFIGADFGNGIQATVGQQDSAYAELKDVTDTFNYFDGEDEDQFGNGRWADSYKVTYAADGWDLRANVAFSDTNKDPSAATTYYKRESALAAGYTFKLDDVQSLKAVLAYQAATQHTTTADNSTDSQYALGLGYTYDAFYLGSTYGQRKHDVAGYKDDIWTATASYKVLPEVTAYTNYEIVDPHNAAGKAAATSPSGENGEFYVFGSEYDFTAKAKAYAEFKLNRVAGYDNQYVVGMQYNF
ncbi:porin [Tolumonas lignilytica]|uniref:porin n=1 Tax=Tolumonas lignilytica TaxID=1283284 RepID=UPI000464C429|nr:porin [Tolumonas lignilytica]